MLSFTPALSGRRQVLSSLIPAMVLPRARGAREQPTPLVPRPLQTTGPFYAVEGSGDNDAARVRLTAEAAQAQREVTHLGGRVLVARGAPVPGALVEIWQCDAF